ncbi:alpha-amylase, partial [bacterium]
MLPLLALPAYGALPGLSAPVVYEVNLRALGPKGGFRELTRRLDGLAKLGTNVVWLMPIYPVGRVRSAGGLGSPYAVADYDRVNPEFGTAEEFRSLVKRAHALKMRVILDWVANHTSWDHPWLKDKDWYSQDGKGDIIIPPGTNWQDAAELNFESVPMRKAMIASMLGWVRRYDIDGFRCDAADFVPADFWRQAIASLREGSKKPLLFLAEGSKREEFEAGFDLMYG